MIIYILKTIKGRYYLCSPFSNKKFFYPKIPKCFVSFQINVHTNECYFNSCIMERKENIAPIEVEMKPVINKTNPFTKESGNKYSSYCGIIQLSTPYVKLLIYLFKSNKKDLPRFEDLNNFARNVNFTYKEQAYRCVKIEEYDNYSKQHAMTKDVENDDDESENEDESVKRYWLQKPKPVKTVEVSISTIVYDIETYNYCGILYPFIIYAKSSHKNKEFIWSKKDENFTNEYKHGVNEFIRWIADDIIEDIKKYYHCEDLLQNKKGQKIYNPHVINMYGYNNYGFDDHFLYNAMIKIFTNYGLKFASRYGKTTGCHITFKDSGIEFNVVDLIKYFPATSLSKACKSFQIKMQKFDIDIVKYVNDCTSKNALIMYCEDYRKYIKEEANLDSNFFNKYKIGNHYNLYQIIIDYCIRDVEATEELYEKTKDNMHNVFKLFKDEKNVDVPSWDIFSYISPPQIAFILFKGMMRNAGENFFKFDNELSEFIWQSYFGGNTGFTVIGDIRAGKKDNHWMKYLYLDITSSYPCSAFDDFPSAREDSIVLYGDEFPLEEIQNDLDNAYLHRWHLFMDEKLHDDISFLDKLRSYRMVIDCNIIPPTDKKYLTSRGPVPLRLRENSSVKLEFPNHRQNNRILSSGHIFIAIAAGWKVEINKNKNNILFRTLSPIIKDYMQTIGHQKTISTDNPALRNLWKLLLNSLYGKLAMKSLNVTTNTEIQNGSILENERIEEHDFSLSHHILATQITSNSQFTLFWECLRAELEQMYQGKTLEERVNTVLYWDTDSMIVNSTKISSFFLSGLRISEEIGPMFAANWKLEDEFEGLIVFAKKSYFCYRLSDNDELTLVVKKGKGIRKKDLDLADYQLLKQGLDDKPIEFCSEGLRRNLQLMQNNTENGYQFDFRKQIVTKMIKSKLEKTKYDQTQVLQCKCELTYETNKACIDREIFNEDTRHFLVFIKPAEISIQEQNLNEQLEDIFEKVINGK